MPLSKTNPELHKLRLSLALKGRKKTPEWNKKIGDAQRGSKNHMFKKTGVLNHFYGRKHSPESIAKMSASHKGYLVGDKNPSKRLDVRRKISLSKMGANSPLWRGGIAKVNNTIRHSFEYKEWRKAVYQRDEYTCCVCGDDTGGNLEAHHIKQFALILKEQNISTAEQARNCPELWQVSNGLTMCIDCHKKTDTYLKIINI